MWGPANKNRINIRSHKQINLIYCTDLCGKKNEYDNLHYPIIARKFNLSRSIRENARKKDASVKILSKQKIYPFPSALFLLSGFLFLIRVIDVHIISGLYVLIHHCNNIMLAITMTLMIVATIVTITQV